jgi:UrcA family protein
MNRPRTPAFVAATLLATFTLMGTASLAHAAAPSDTQQETVRFGDLNLATQAGLQALYLRIQNAARDVCGPSQVAGTRIASGAWKDCVSASIHDAILQINQPSLTAYYAAQLRNVPFRTTG